MIERSEDLRLASKTAEPLRVGDEQVRQDLDGDVAIQFRIARAIHLAHAAGPEGRQHFIRAEAGTRLQGHERRDERLYEDTGQPIITMPSESGRDQTPLIDRLSLLPDSRQPSTGRRFKTGIVTSAFRMCVAHDVS